MNKNIRSIAINATKYCIDVAENKAWLWEDKFAELIIKDVIKTASSKAIELETKMMSANLLETLLKEEYGLN